MKKNLLIFLFCLVASVGMAQTASQRVEVSVFPNPASHYIELNNDALVRTINIISITGKKVRAFEVYNTERFDISDLPNGMYLVQIVGKNNRILTTQRLNKRS